jgi:hypothetical protein
VKATPHDETRLFPCHRARRLIDEVRGVKGQYGVSEASWQFLNDLSARGALTLSERQEKWLDQIERQVFPDDFLEDEGL